MSSANEYKIIELPEVDSTSRYLKDYCSVHKSDFPIFCFTSNQTNGYGQQNKSWISNAGSLTFSMSYPVAKNRYPTGIISLQIARILHLTLQSVTAEKLYLKWPNDLYNDKGKVAGILIEQVIEKGFRCLILGVGVNRSDIDGEINASSLGYFDNTLFFAEFYAHIKALGLFDFSIDELQQYWSHHDYFEIGEPVKLLTDMNSQKEVEQGLQCFYDGITQEGLAKILCINAEGVTTETLLSSGLNSLRKI